MTQSFRRLASAAALALSVSLSGSGCSTQQYEQQMAASLVAHERANRFSKLYAAALQLPGTPVSLRVPEVFKVAFTPESKDPVQLQETVRPERVQPPFIELPGFIMCYEKHEFGPEGNFPFYCYLAATANPDKASADALRDRLAAAFPDATVAWEDFAAETPDGGRIAWKRLVVQGVQPFFQGGTNNPVEKPGIFLLYRYEGGGYEVLVGWRCPDSIKDRAAVEQLAELVAGTISVKAEAPPGPAQ